MLGLGRRRDAGDRLEDDRLGDVDEELDDSGVELRAAAPPQLGDRSATTAPVCITVNARLSACSCGTWARLRFTPTGWGGNRRLEDLYVDPLKGV